MTNQAPPKLTHFTSIDALSQQDLLYFIERARYFRDHVMAQHQVLDRLSGRVVTALFFEPSTRTLNSFLLAAKRLNALTLAPNLAFSATVKGESLIDTIQTYEAMGTDVFIIRHSDNRTPEFISTEIQTNTHIINAGDGTNRHPTQAMLDIMTIYEHKKDFSKLSVAIVGDIIHSRVANSLVVALGLMGTQDIRLVAPPNLVEASQTPSVTIHHNLAQGIQDADVVISLRIQNERFKEDQSLNKADYIADFCLTKERLKHAKPDAIVMHPGPINRDVELSSDVADSTRSTIREQVTNGVAMRMAILDTLLTNN